MVVSQLGQMTSAPRPALSVTCPVHPQVGHCTGGGSDIQGAIRERASNGLGPDRHNRTRLAGDPTFTMPAGVAQDMEQTVVVTGAESGLGAAIARAFGVEEANLGLGGRDIEAVQSVAGDVEMAGGTSVTLRTDARDEFDVERLVETTAREFGAIDVLVPAQVVAHDPEGAHDLSQVSYPAFDDVIRSTLRGSFSTIREAVPHLADDGCILIPLPNAKELETRSRPVTIAGAGQRGLIEVASMDLDQAVVGIEHPSIARGEDDPDADETVARGFVRATLRAAELDGTITSPTTVPDAEHS